MTDQASPKFQRLWPTLFMSVKLPGASTANPVLAELLLNLDATADDLTGDYLGQDLFQHPNPAIGWLQQCCHRAVVDYASEAGLDYQPEVDLQAWVNVNRRGDYHNLHNHPHSWLSGTYYVVVPDQSAVTQHRTDLNPGEISFYDPRAQANMNAVRGDGQFDPEYRRLPEPGDLFLWPSFLHHLVHPNLVDEPRISVSFNAVLRRKML
ncbi:MAG: 2OG-Fe(II) oxygenase family protein [Pseudomonadota bacterium]